MTWLRAMICVLDASAAAVQAQAMQPPYCIVSRLLKIFPGSGALFPLGVLAIVAPVEANDALPLSAAQWAQVRAVARDTVAAESPASAFPFLTAKPGAHRPIVIAHYFPPFPISIDNKLSGEDYYAVHYLRPQGENGKFLAQGGYLRQRPLAVPIRPAELATATNLAVEVARAARIGIDAFGIDLLTIDNNRMWQNALLMLDVARQVAPGFRIVPEPDMVALQKEPIEQIATAIARFADHPASYRLPDGRLLVMPFAAEARDAAFWQALKARMAARGTPIALVLDYVDAKAMATNTPQSWGASIWGDRDPPAGQIALAQRDRAQEAGIRAWFMPVAPQDARAKSGIFTEARNTEAFRSQWRAAIAARPAGIHLITWNDYSETSEIAPSSFTQFLFYDLAAYYIAWAKRGAAPLIRRDALYYAQRNQILNPADSSRGLGPQLRAGTPLANDVELIALLTRPGRLRIQVGGRSIERNVPAGLQTLRMPAVPGRPEFSLLRGSRTVLKKRSALEIEARPTRHDATYGGGSSTREVAH